MRKSNSFILPKTDRACSKLLTLFNKENNLRTSKKSKGFEINLQNKPSNRNKEDIITTKMRSLSSKPSSKCSVETDAESIKSVSTKKVIKPNNEKIKRYFTSFKKKKYSELKTYNSTNRKRVVLGSNKKVFRDTIRFNDPSSKKTHTFPLYSDREVLNIYFKNNLITQELDNDVETDEEQLKDARRYLFDSLLDGINAFRMCK